MSGLFSILHVGYTPFITPMAWVHDWWYLLLPPLALGISMIWKAVRVWTFDDFWRQTVVMTVQVVLVMIVLAVVLNVFVEWGIPAMAAE